MANQKIDTKWIKDLDEKLNEIFVNDEFRFNQFATDESSFEIALKPRYLTITTEQTKKIRELGFIVGSIHIWTSDLLVQFIRENKQ